MLRTDPEVLVPPHLQTDWERQVVSRVDTKLVDKSPLGFEVTKKHINSLEHAKSRYLAYGLANHHPTLVRLEHKLACSHRTAWSRTVPHT